MAITDLLENHMLPCFYKSLTGHPCPGCGFQRSVVELLKGDFSSSFETYPPLFPVIFLLLVALANIKFEFRYRLPLLYGAFILAVFTIIINFLIKTL